MTNKVFYIYGIPQSTKYWQ